MEMKGIGWLACWLTEAEDQGKSDEGTRDSWRNVWLRQSRDRHWEKKRDTSARSSFHTSNEVTQHCRVGGKRPIAINATDILSRQERRVQTRVEGDTRTEYGWGDERRRKRGRIGKRWKEEEQLQRSTAAQPKRERDDVRGCQCEVIDYCPLSLSHVLLTHSTIGWPELTG